jgi:hypothetical protein
MFLSFGRKWVLSVLVRGAAADHKVNRPLVVGAAIAIN